ncbi:hypothetical protein GCM10010869_06230 [Mesorhizobium tianshanense]|uniref:HEPN AbiU2-like domain-containing protein n=1 Tax=Mesorhizobium tianshanense TaxID=39844 RepID=A0A562NMW6_9HYPH|nr:hypothetical protein [Mesorhizobium tianshanense]TWI33096.1 hypothetical protein IQ26_04096 [Mesorhizobium tianshanense]GLS35035.1 hypothetical protein GCM10010869_06230 [Mesorhizobium tianshanense]
MQRSAQQIERISRWREAFRDDTTGIHKTVQDLLWNYAAFRTTVRIVRLANERREARPPLNQMLFNLISEGYWSSLLLGTRRLLDKAPLNSPKGVYSIRSVVKDVETSRGWITRRIYVEKVLDAQYDLDRLRREEHEKLTAAKGGVIWGDPELMKSEAAHRHFDTLSGVSHLERSPDDLIDPAIFTRIEARLAALDGIAVHVSTHVAHAGNKESRLNKLLDDFDIRDARKTLKQLKEVADLTGVWFANEGGTGLATYIGDQFEGLDQPVVQKADIADLAEQWRVIDREVANWSIDPAGL